MRKPRSSLKNQRRMRNTIHSGSFYFSLQSFELFTEMKMRTKWNEDYSNIACLWGLRQFRKKSQRCRRAVINLLELATPLWCQSLHCWGQMLQDRSVRCFPPANTLISLMKSWAAWRWLPMLRTWSIDTSPAATSKSHPKWYACSQGNLELKPADFPSLHAL